MFELVGHPNAWWTSNNIGFENKSQPKAHGFRLWEFILKRLSLNAGWCIILMILALQLFSFELLLMLFSDGTSLSLPIYKEGVPHFQVNAMFFGFFWTYRVP